MSTSVKIGSYKGSPTITLDADSRYPFTFGAKKAALIVEHFEQVKRFAETNAVREDRKAQGDDFDKRVEDNMRDAVGA